MTFDEIYSNYHTLIELFTHDWESDHHRAEDLIQDFYVYLIESCQAGKFDKYVDETHVAKAAIIRTCLRYFLIDSQRQVQAAFERGQESNQELVNNTVIEEDIFDSFREEFDLLLPHLTLEQQGLLKLVSEGLDVPAIADRLGLQQPATRHRIDRAKAAARELANMTT